MHETHQLLALRMSVQNDKFVWESTPQSISKQRLLPSHTFWKSLKQNHSFIAKCKPSIFHLKLTSTDMKPHLPVKKFRTFKLGEISIFIHQDYKYYTPNCLKGWLQAIEYPHPAPEFHQRSLAKWLRLEPGTRGFGEAKLEISCAADTGSISVEKVAS